MKIEIKQLLPLLVASALLALFACGKSDGSKNMENMEGMSQGEPEKMQPVSSKTKPSGNSDMSGMDMPNAAAFDDSLDISSYVLPANYRVVSTQKTVMAMPNDSTNVIKAPGYLAPDERRNNKVSARFSGRIEKLYVRYNMQRVKKGEKILDLYSTELNTYQEELLFLLKGNSDPTLVEKAEQKLRLLGLTPAQINHIKKTGEAVFSISIYSPQGGYVLFTPSAPAGGMGAAGKSEGMGDGMGGGGGSPSGGGGGSGGSQIREGDYVSKGQTLFWVNDLQQVWVMLAVDNRRQQELKQGLPVKIISELYPDETIPATLNLIEPAYQKNQKFILARAYLKNPGGKYKINSLVETEITPAKSSALTVPYSSVLFLGKRKIVWVLTGKTPDGNKIFEARDVHVSAVYEGIVVIKSGLSKGEEVALDAGYLLDREGLIQPE